MYKRMMRRISAIAVACLLGLSLMACGVPAQQQAQTPAPTAAVEATPFPVVQTPAPEESTATPPAMPEETPTPEAPQEGTAPGMIAPDFTLEARDGTMLTLSELRGKPVFLNLFATWCGPCVREMPDIQAVYEEYGSRVHFLAVNLGEDKATVDAFLDKYGFTFPVVYDYDGAVSDAYRVMYIPQTYMLDENGTILEVIEGSTNAEAMTALIENALGHV